MTVGEITGAEEFLDMLESDALKGGEWVERFRGFLDGIHSVGRVDEWVLDSVDQVLQEEGFVRGQK